MDESKNAWALPDKFTDDLVDEHGNKMSKRCGQSAAHGLEKIVLLVQICMGCSLLHGSPMLQCHIHLLRADACELPRTRQTTS